MSKNTRFNSYSQEQYETKVQSIHPNILVLENYINNKTKIKHKCVIDNFEWETAPSNILSGCGCPCCGKKIIGYPPNYINSIWASPFKETLSSFLTEKQMKEYMPYSSKKIVAICPNCNTSKVTTPALLVRRGIKCQGCNDGVSFPNKFSRAFIKQIPNVHNIQFEFSPDWLIVDNHKCFYDIYFEYNNSKYIIEMDGNLGHGNFAYNENAQKYGRNHDIAKDNLALKHNIEVIRIDAKVSSLDYLKKNILDSKLVDILNLDNLIIDWKLCAEIATSSLAVKARDLWEQNYLIKDIAKELELSTSTVKRYLKQMSDIGACSYTVNKSRKRAAIPKRTVKGRKIIDIETNTIYESISCASKEINLSYNLIRARCKRKKNFRYYDEWLKEIS